MVINMNITGILIATLLVGAVGLFVGLFLGVAGIKFKVEVDEREEAILGVLPGNNCGGCGYAGCSGLAAAIVKGEAPANACPVGGEKVGSLRKKYMLLLFQKVCSLLINLTAKQGLKRL